MFLTIPLCGNTSCTGFSRPERRIRGFLTGINLRILSFDCADISHRKHPKKCFNHNRLSIEGKVCLEHALPMHLFAGHRRAVTDKLNQIVTGSKKRFRLAHRPFKATVTWGRAGRRREREHRRARPKGFRRRFPPAPGGPVRERFRRPIPPARSARSARPSRP